MAKQENNLQVLTRVLRHFSSEPFFVLSSENQNKIKQELNNIFFGLRSELNSEEITNEIIDLIDEILLDLKQPKIDEYFLAKKIAGVVSLVSDPNDPDFISLDETINQLSVRAKDLWLSEKIAREKESELSHEEILNHDKVILEKEMQLYALDYFLQVCKNLHQGGGIELVTEQQGDMPSLYDDALADDMLKKIVYSLWGHDLRWQMIRDYFEYKAVFQNLSGKDNEKLTTVTEALTKYCSQLLNLSLEYGIVKQESGIFFPFGNDIRAIKKEIQFYD